MSNARVVHLNLIYAAAVAVVWKNVKSAHANAGLPVSIAKHVTRNLSQAAAVAVEEKNVQSVRNVKIAKKSARNAHVSHAAVASCFRTCPTLFLPVLPSSL